MFGIGVSNMGVAARGAAGSPAFSPKSLFAAGEQGAWFDPSDLSTLFQDVAGANPVTAAGQPVGLMRDKSGRGHHVSQTTTTARPILRQDAKGKYYLAFDGVDDRLATADTINLTGSDKAALVYGINITATGNTRIIAESSANYYNAPGTFIIFAESAGTTIAALRGDIMQATGISSAIPTAPTVEAVSYDLAGANYLTEVIVRRNGAPGSTTRWNALNAGAGGFGNHPLYIGRRADGSYPFKGGFYGFILRGGKLKDADIAGLEGYLNERTDAY